MGRCEGLTALLAAKKRFMIARCVSRVDCRKGDCYCNVNSHSILPFFYTFSGVLIRDLNSGIRLLLTTTWKCFMRTLLETVIKAREIIGSMVCCLQCCLSVCLSVRACPCGSRFKF
jgi:hypothetical protein